MRLTRPVLCASATLLMLGCEASRPRSGEVPGLARGAAVYRNACLPCHGARGDGHGPVAAFLAVKPRDFRHGSFKFRSTATGTQPTTLDLVRTISAGVHGTSMPPFTDLDRADTFSVIARVRAILRAAMRADLEKAVAAGDLPPEELDEVLADRLQPGEPIEIPPEPPYDEASIGRGRKLYARMNCTECHGPAGRGDGPAAAGLEDDWGRPIVPADFTLPGGIKGGATAKAVYRTFMTGLDGTPMPSFASQLEPKEAWDLAHFVLWLRR